MVAPFPVKDVGKRLEADEKKRREKRLRDQYMPGERMTNEYVEKAEHIPERPAKRACA
eukprot:COSAG03_NODE_385_length_8317_cov_7.240813_4_plen_58_part_00